MQVIELTKNDYRLWDDFCLESDDAWFWHTSDWLEYNLAYKPEFRSRLRSFYILKDKKIAAVCPLILNDVDGVKEYSLGGVHGPAPALANHLAKKEKEKIQKIVFARIDELAAKDGVKIIKMKIPVLTKNYLESPRQNFNFLEKFGYFNSSINSQVIEIFRPLEELRSDLRHGHDYDISRAAKLLEAEIFDRDNISEEVFKKYQAMHKKAAGRATRPQSTFELTRQWIKEGKGFLVAAKRQGRYLGFAYFLFYKGNAFYASACNDPEAGNLPVAHFIHWSAISWMKNNGCKFYEIGWSVFYSGISDYSTPKRISIGKFERGFGGLLVPLFMGEKYFDRRLFLETCRQKLETFAQNI